MSFKKIKNLKIITTKETKMNYSDKKKNIHQKVIVKDRVTTYTTIIIIIIILYPHCCIVY